jgi:predicted neutral ceramidase superfamily lipid hydrolase
MLPGEGPLARVPAVAVFVVVAALFAAGVLVGGVVGAVLLGVLALGVAALLAATWPRLSTGERAVRVLCLVVLVAIAVGQVAA